MTQNYVIISTHLHNKLVYLVDISTDSGPIWDKNIDNVLLFGDHRTAESITKAFDLPYYCFIDYKLPVNE